VAWRAQAATGAMALRPFFVFIVFAEWAVRGNPDCWAPGGPLPGIWPCPPPTARFVASEHRGDFRSRIWRRGFLAQGRSVSAIIPVAWSATAGSPLHF